MSDVHSVQNSYSGCCECVFYHAYYQEGFLLFRHIKIKASEVPEKNNSFLKYSDILQQHLLKVQVKLHISLGYTVELRGNAC